MRSHYRASSAKTPCWANAVLGEVCMVPFLFSFKHQRICPQLLACMFISQHSPTHVRSSSQYVQGDLLVCRIVASLCVEKQHYFSHNNTQWEFYFSRCTLTLPHLYSKQTSVLNVVCYVELLRNCCYSSEKKSKSTFILGILECPEWGAQIFGFLKKTFLINKWGRNSNLELSRHS